MGAEASEGVVPPAPDLSTLNVSELTPLTPEIIERQATINFGTIGHVAHGKSTVVRAVSGVQTIRFKHEKERNITIKLGYGNAKIFKCADASCQAPGCYKSTGSAAGSSPKCDQCEGKMILQRHVSFVDCPGHDILMATMLNGAAVMDAALLLIAGNESCPQPQTSEHLAAVEIMQLRNILVLQNKIELIQSDAALAHREEIRQFVSGTKADGAPIIPLSAVLKYNIDILCEYMCTQVPVPMRDFTAQPHMIIIRSFDVNKPGEGIESLQGGVAGGSLLTGILKVGDPIEIRPGLIKKDEKDEPKCTPIRSTIVSLFAEQNHVRFAVPGGLIGVGTNIDPSLTRSDRLVGMVLGIPGTLPACWTELEINFYLLRRLLGVKTQEGGKTTRISKLARGEFLMLNVGSSSIGARITSAQLDTAVLKVQEPVCTSIGDRVSLSRRVEKHWRLIGWGRISAGVEIDMSS